MSEQISNSTIEKLKSIDTCTVANVIEAFRVRLQNEGFTNPTIHCRFPKLPPMVGFAVTLRIRTSNPPMEGGRYVERTEWLDSFDFLPTPYVIVIEDLDAGATTGAFVGAVHAAILTALGCVGVVTNGAVRSLAAAEAMGLQLFSGSVSPSHSFVHVVEASGPVEVAGLRVTPGNLIHGDQHGVVVVPAEVAELVPAEAARLRRRDKEIISYCEGGDFSRLGLRRLLSRRRG
jgi:4-hydroxy-4-methyl-2-oxoglutarate aldolase